ncbi:hypothetical protein K438DRAFT_1773750 [Mycena galopus ATCC 62051]|nr:hypothetical protein K438DRAFT_1773750 [Mycena galopus ATCC 62051]
MATTRSAARMLQAGRRRRAWAASRMTSPAAFSQATAPAATRQAVTTSTCPRAHQPGNGFHLECRESGHDYYHSFRANAGRKEDVPPAYDFIDVDASTRRRRGEGRGRSFGLMSEALLSRIGSNEVDTANSTRTDDCVDVERKGIDGALYVLATRSTPGSGPLGAVDFGSWLVEHLSMPKLRQSNVPMVSSESSAPANFPAMVGIMSSFSATPGNQSRFYVIVNGYLPLARTTFALTHRWLKIHYFNEISYYMSCDCLRRHFVVISDEATHDTAR